MARRDARTQLAKELGLCNECNNKTTRYLCIPCTRKKSAQRTPIVRRVCTYCCAEGHNSRTCEALVADTARFAAIEARLAATQSVLSPHQKLEWEINNDKRAALIEALEYIASLPKTATTWKAVAKAALRNV